MDGDINLTGTFRVNGTAQTTADAANNATITLAAGTGLSTGGDFTTNQSSNETITFNVAGLTTSELAAASLQTGSESFADSDTVLMTAAAIQDKIESYSYTTNAGDITGVTAGVGLSGGGSSGGVTLTLDMSELTDMTQAINSSEDELILLDDGADRRKLISEIPLSAFNNDSGFTANTGDITGVTAGVGLSGGGSSGGVTLAVDVSEFSAVTPASGDSFLTLDSDGSTEQRTTVDALATLLAGSGLSATSGVLAVGTLNQNTTGSAGSVTNSLTVDNTTLQLNSNTTYDGSAARTISAKTSAVADGSAALVTGDQVYDYIDAQNFGSGSGDITAVVAGTGLSGGATSGSATVNLSHLGIESLSDPDGDRLLIWDDSAGAIVFASANSNLAISGTNVNATDTNTTYSVGDGGLTEKNFTVTLFNKLDNIEASATADQTAVEIIGLLNSDLGGNFIIGNQTSDRASFLGDVSAGGFATNGTWTFDTSAGNTTGITQVDVGSAFTDDDTTLMSAGAIKEKIESYGYSTTTGDITGVTAGTNLSGGGTSGSVTLNVDDAFLVNDANDTTTGTITAAGFTTTGTWTFDEYSSGTVGITTVQDSGTSFNDNDTSLMTAAAIADKIEAYGFGTGGGDITAVTAGTGLSGGGSSGGVTVALSHLGLESLADPDADRVLGWDDSAGALAWFTLNTKWH